MTKKDIPSLYILTIYYKRRLKRALNYPWIIKERIKTTKNRLEGICRRSKRGRIVNKLGDASSEHLFFSFFFIFLGCIFLGFFFATYDSFVYFINHYDVRNLYLYFTPIFMSLIFFIVGFGIIFDAYSKWLVKINNIDITYEELKRNY